MVYSPGLTGTTGVPPVGGTSGLGPLLPPTLSVDGRLRNELPLANTPWPPVRFNPITWDMRTWSAWYSGDPDQLMRAYYSIGANSPLGRQFFATTGESGTVPQRPGQARGGLIGSIRRFFWGQPTPPGEKRTNYHVPVAGDIAATSSRLLFSEPPALKSAHAGTQDYLNELMGDETQAKLLEAAELCSALGGVFLRVVWDREVADHAWVDLVPADAAIPEFRYDKLRAVTFWREVDRHGRDVVRHLEKHIPGQNVILHAVYVGDDEKIGTRRPLGDFAATAPLVPWLEDGEYLSFPDQPFDASTVVYIPNLRPNRVWRDLEHAGPLGRSDFSGTEGLMDALDEAYSSWMRDIRLGKARLIVPPSYLNNIGRGKGAVFEPEQEVFTPLNLLVTDKADPSQMIVAQQFAIRWKEHQETCSQLWEQIINGAGYSSQTFGMEGDIAKTATEVEAREKKTLQTRKQKIGYWRPGLQDIIYGLLSIQNQVFGENYELERPDVEFPDTIQPSPLEAAQVTAAWRTARIASLQTSLQHIHPDWDQEAIDTEAQRLHEEIGYDITSRTTLRLQPGPLENTSDILSELSAPTPYTAIPGQTDVPGKAETTVEGD